MISLALLSGGMDSAACLLWAAENSISDRAIHAICFDYGQVAETELAASALVWDIVKNKCFPDRNWGLLHKVRISPQMFGGDTSILGRSEIAQYDDAQQAVEQTRNDKSLLPLRNAIFLSVAAHHALCIDPEGGNVFIGIRGRDDANNPGFPDCTNSFALRMSWALSQGSGGRINVIDPLNHHAMTRASTIELIRKYPYGDAVLAASISCYHGIMCGKCLPCTRRAQAFEELGISDPCVWVNQSKAKGE